MASFAYTARDAAGAAFAGTFVADTIDDVTRMLRADGKFPTSIRSASGGGAGVSRGAKVETIAPSPRGIGIARGDVIQLCTMIGVMVETGVTISEALDCIAAQADKPPIKRLADDLARTVKGGGDFSTALARHPRSFPRVLVALMKAAERSGMLSKLLVRATAYMRDEHETVRKVRGAMMYPAMMMLFAIATTVFLLAFVLPKFTAIYAAKAAALPAPTRMLMAVSDFLVNHYILLPTIVVGLVVSAWLYVRTPAGLRTWHMLQLRAPLMGPLFRKLHLSRGLRTIGTMAGSGVTLVECVATAQDLCPNVYFRGLWDTIGTQIRSGRQLSEPLFQSPLVPRSVSQMIASAEKGGRLAPVLEQVAGFAEAELKERITELTRYVEPAMIIVMGAIIGSVSIALLLPIFSLSRVMAQ